MDSAHFWQSFRSVVFVVFFQQILRVFYVDIWFSNKLMNWIIIIIPYLRHNIMASWGTCPTIWFRFCNSDISFNRFAAHVLSTDCKNTFAGRLRGAWKRTQGRMCGSANPIGQCTKLSHHNVIKYGSELKRLWIMVHWWKLGEIGQPQPWVHRETDRTDKRDDQQSRELLRWLEVLISLLT